MDGALRKRKEGHVSEWVGGEKKKKKKTERRRQSEGKESDRVKTRTKNGG